MVKVKGHIMYLGCDSLVSYYIIIITSSKFKHHLYKVNIIICYATEPDSIRTRNKYARRDEHMQKFPDKIFFFFFHNATGELRIFFVALGSNFNKL
jgi:hypothetical protein